MSDERGERKSYTGSKGELTKVNVEGCKECGKVYVSIYNSIRLQVMPGWYLLANLQQKHPGDRNQDVVIRVRGRRWGGILGQRVCPDCKAKKVK
ncbi:hypothetical protein HZA75_04900 [Candidatus Roizmanbacteria bacterium]|nr:hypothetical protein [Candidatus Roizmanbacteria bacterium]